MDEAARFLRYVIPGLVSILVAYLFLAILEPSVARDLLSGFGEGGKAFTAALTIFLGSGALGYIHANIYFAAFRRCDCLIFDNRSLFTGANPVLRAVDRGRNAIMDLNRREIWSIVGRYWASELGSTSGADLRELNKFVGTLVHHVHSHGASAVGALLALPYCWVALRIFNNGLTSATAVGKPTDPSCCDTCWRYIIVLVVLTIVQIVFWVARQYTKQTQEWIVNSQVTERIGFGAVPHDVVHVRNESL